MSKGIIFDLDGTLVDSAAAILAGLRHAISSAGHPDPGDAALRAVIGTPLDSTFDKGLGLPSEHIGQARAAYRDHWRSHGRSMTRLFAGAEELLQDLRTAGWQMAVATAKTTDGAVTAVERHGLQAYFEDRVFGFEAGADQGKVAIVERAMQSLGRQEICFVGDAVLDAEAAQAHGLDFIWCRYGYGDATAGQHAQAIIDHIDQLRPHLLDTI